ncbi:uncharacterized protein LOC102199898 [Pundamilia nyererei]|uniref:Uncharacterized protein LOC102199898 n=1 Tax=Pundamilia nyererei TaxID=303518 RepID=A0A9Y3VTW6_9CICH|nr:PREDICTED: uncharacterized protein LOC102199898 [Pundamilia nyererei]
MPQACMNFEPNRRGTYHSSRKTNDLINNTGLVNGAVVYNGCSASASRISRSTPAGTQHGPKPTYRINDYFNYGYKGKSTKAAPSGTLKKQGCKIPALCDAPASDGNGSEDLLSGNSAKVSAPPSNIDQKVPDPSLSASGKKKRWRRSRHKKRDKEVVYPEILSPAPIEAEEDWGKEIQEGTRSDWKNMCFRVRPYGPEDVLRFALQDLTLKQRDTAALPVSASYTPAVHHPHPLIWSRHIIPTEPDQFADAD